MLRETLTGLLLLLITMQGASGQAAAGNDLLRIGPDGTIIEWQDGATPLTDIAILGLAPGNFYEFVAPSGLALVDWADGMGELSFNGPVLESGTYWVYELGHAQPVVAFSTPTGSQAAPAANLCYLVEAYVNNVAPGDFEVHVCGETPQAPCDSVPECEDFVCGDTLCQLFLPCDTVPECQAFVCGAELCDVELPCDGANCVAYACDVAPLPDGCRTPCSGAGCVDYLCAQVTLPGGCNGPCSTAKSCSDYVCAELASCDLPCNDCDPPCNGAPDCVTQVCEAAGGCRIEDPHPCNAAEPTDQDRALCLALSNPGTLVQNCEYGAMVCAIAGAHAQREEVDDVPKDLFTHLEQAGGGNPNGLGAGTFTYLTKIGGAGERFFEPGQTVILMWSDIAAVCKMAFAKSTAQVYGVFTATAQALDNDCET